jgi:hypothetical protein
MDQSCVSIPQESNEADIVVLKVRTRLYRKLNRFSPEEFETAPFENGCLAFRSHDKMSVYLKLNDVRINPGTIWRSDNSCM